MLNLITFTSTLNKNATVHATHELILSELEKYYTLNIVTPEELPRLNKNEFSIVFIATGGVEREVIQYFEYLPRPTVILADGMQNSLAAALEVSSWLRNRGIKSEILHGEIKGIIHRVGALIKNHQAQQTLSGKRIGVIGTPSSWLISSSVDYLLAKRRWGIEYINIPLERVYEKFNLITDEEVGEACANLVSKALACREGSPEDILKAMRLYRAIKEICVEEKLDAFTLSCFKLLKSISTTGCLALALLNDDGILAGCEGDLQSIFTMLAAQIITEKAGFMSNPSSINIHTNELILAHCTIGIKQTEQYIIRNHFETETGIAIQGILPTGEVTIVKCGGESLNEYYLSTGTLTENTNFFNMCRTQVCVKLDSPASYFLKNPLGNHHLLLQGNHLETLNEFFQTNSCKRIE